MTKPSQELIKMHAEYLKAANNQDQKEWTAILVDMMKQENAKNKNNQ